MIKRGIVKEHSEVLDISKRILDILIVIGSAYLAYIYKFGSDTQPAWIYVASIVAGALLSAMCFYIFPLYHAWRGITLFAEYRIVFLAWISQFFLLVIAGFLFKVSTKYSREWLAAWFLIGLFLLLIYRFFLRITLSHYRSLGFNQRSVCLISYGTYGESVYENIVTRPELGFSITAVFSNNTQSVFDKKTLIGKINDCFSWLRNKNNEFDQLWVAVPLEKIEIVQKLIYEMRHRTADIRLLPDLGSYNLLNHSITEVAGMPLINLSMSPMQESYNRLLKRSEDVVIGCLILLLISPLLLSIAIMIKCTSKGPIFYKQARLGLNNDPFIMLKFRSMPPDIEKKTGAVWAKHGENRATKFGSFLRKTSLDELPQFINVVKGDMSIVGPRPERPAFVKKFKHEIPSYMKKHMVKAGITGWAQINGWRGDTGLEKRIEHDIYYIENWSIYFDLKIIIITVIKGFINKNAY